MGGRREFGAVIEKLKAMRLVKAAEFAETSAGETLTYYAFPEEHWRRIRTNNPLERLTREIRRRTVSVRGTRLEDDRPEIVSPAAGVAGDPLTSYCKDYLQI